MKLKAIFPILFIASLAWIVIVSSCANPGMPIGGAKDTIPPVLLRVEPGYHAVNFKGDNVKLTFNEFINTEKIAEMLVVSPPMVKKPIVRTKSKTLVVEFREDLKDSTTYSLDFKNSIADNNEQNPFPDFRYSFSTGPIFDSLRVSGQLTSAFNLEPIESGLVMLHSNQHDSAVYRVKPDYIAKTDKKGKFLIDNIAPGSYHLFSVIDANSNLLYDEGAEEIAFEDSLIIPGADFVEEIDTIKTATDTIVIYGHTRFLPDPIFLYQFSENIFSQYIKTSKRDTRYKCTFVFNESVKDSFQLRVINNDTADWYKMEDNENVDSLIVWIADTAIANLDTLFMEVSYLQLDSLKQLYLEKDTIDMTYFEPEKRGQKKKKPKDGEEIEPEPIEQFSLQTNVKNSTIELNKNIGIITPEPIQAFDTTKIHFYLAEDTLKTPLPFKFEKDTVEWRQYNISYQWIPGADYKFEIDSAAVVNIFGITNRKFKAGYKAREEDFYGTVQLSLSNVETPLVLQILANTKDEKIIAEKTTDKDGKVLFDYLAPEKYKVKVIYDRNGNGRWDTGSYQDKIQPERVMYINEIIKVRGNWDSTFSWDLKTDNNFVKNIRDLEQEEKERKEKEEKARKEKEGEKVPVQRQNLMPGSEGSGMFN